MAGRLQQVRHRGAAPARRRGPAAARADQRHSDRVQVHRAGDFCAEHRIRPRRRSPRSPTRSCCATEWGGQLCGVSSTSSADPHEIPAVYPRGPFRELQRARRRGDRRLGAQRRHDLLGRARPRQRARAGTGRFPTGGQQAGRRGLRALRLDRDDRAHAQRGRQRLHARSRDRGLHVDAPRHAHSRRYARLRRLVAPAVRRAADPPLHRGVRGRRSRAA